MAGNSSEKKKKKVVGFSVKDNQSGSESDRADDLEHMKEDLKEQKKKCAELRLQLKDAQKNEQQLIKL